MPKIKTRKAAAKRFKVTKRRKILRRKGGKGHLLSVKTKKRNRALRRATLVSKSERRKILRLLPYA